MAMKKTKEKKAPERKTEALSIRIDPRVKYGLDLLARHQRRAVTGVVEWSVAEAFRNQNVVNSQGVAIDFDQALLTLWADNELERLLRLWFFYPTLLSFEESRVVNVLLRTGELWGPGGNAQYNNFKWGVALAAWQKLKPVLEEAADRPVVKGLTDDDLTRADLEDLILPF